MHFYTPNFSYVSGRLETNQSASIEIWYDWNNSDMIKADCQLWCSNKDPHHITRTTKVSVS